MEATYRMNVPAVAVVVVVVVLSAAVRVVVIDLALACPEDVLSCLSSCWAQISPRWNTTLLGS